MSEEPNFAFEKKLRIAECVYGDIPMLSNLISKLFICMQETNKLHKVECEFFRLDFRQAYFYEQFEFPLGSLILDLKWGSKKELEKNKKDE